MKRIKSTGKQKVALIKDLSLFEYAVAISLIFAFAVTLML